jgi:tetratricopeptide (TPR) repeat protein
LGALHPKPQVEHLELRVAYDALHPKPHVIRSEDMSTEILPTAEGDLGRTPFAHLLVYAADQQLTGALFLHVSGGVMHSVRLEGGRPVKVQMGDGFARLGTLLIEAGMIDKKTHDLPRIVPGLIGESLVAGGHISRETLDNMVERQFFVRMTRLFDLPAATRYAYFADMHEIIDDGAPNSAVHPLAAIWAGLREHATTSVMMQPILERVGTSKLKLHRDAALERLQLTNAERAVIDQLRDESATIRSLVSTNPTEEALVRRIVYGLVILRFINFGTDALPLFPEKKPTMPPESTSTVPLARIRLQQNAQRRFIAAAPDDVGDGERIRPQPRTRKRSRSSTANATAVKTNALNPAVVRADSLLEVKPNSPGEKQSRPTLVMKAPVVRSDETTILDPGQTMYEIAQRRLRDGDRQGALVACQQACEIDPDEPNYLALVTWIRAVIGGANLDTCVHALDKILRQRPDHVPALFYRGYLRRCVGDEAGALTDLYRVLELDPTHDDARRELDLIERRAPAKRPSGLYQA